MPTLSTTLRNHLERTVIAARDIAEQGAWAALERLAVNKAEPLSHMTAEQRELRVKLRAKGRQLGDVREKNGDQDIDHLHRECAYEVWHQMLFARFLAENNLLIHPEMQVPVTLEECDELAAEESSSRMGIPARQTDGWTLAARFASRMLPQIFRPDDPLLGVTFAPEDKQALEKLLAGLPIEVFTADELPAVTQLFTEDYMVKFLLHNTLGAWWAGKVLADEIERGPVATSEDDWRERVALPGYTFDYLRFTPAESSLGIRARDDSEDDGQECPSYLCTARPAAGTFDGWPKQAAELKIMDPCCGSGHFLVAAFELMVRIRMEEEGLGAVEACDAVLRDNILAWRSIRVVRRSLPSRWPSPRGPSPVSHLPLGEGLGVRAARSSAMWSVWCVSKRRR
ncbi:MAG: hypothetical protein ACC628_07470 [Pirellulaceae bacterium]